MIGRIRSSTPAGINLRTDFFDDIFIPFDELPEGAELYVKPGLSCHLDASLIQP